MAYTRNENRKLEFGLIFLDFWSCTITHHSGIALSRVSIAKSIPLVLQDQLELWGVNFFVAWLLKFTNFYKIFCVLIYWVHFEKMLKYTTNCDDLQWDGKLIAILFKDRFIGYQATNEYRLGAADCLCYRFFPSISDILSNHSKIVGSFIISALYCLLRNVCECFRTISKITTTRNTLVINI